jgi:hypothetical protein
MVSFLSRKGFGSSSYGQGRERERERERESLNERETNLVLAKMRARKKLDLLHTRIFVYASMQNANGIY